MPLPLKFKFSSSVPPTSTPPALSSPITTPYLKGPIHFQPSDFSAPITKLLPSDAGHSPSGLPPCSSPHNHSVPSIYSDCTFGSSSVESDADALAPVFVVHVSPSLYFVPLIWLSFPESSHSRNSGRCNTHAGSCDFQTRYSTT